MAAREQGKKMNQWEKVLLKKTSVLVLPSTATSKNKVPFLISNFHHLSELSGVWLQTDLILRSFFSFDLIFFD